MVNLHIYMQSFPIHIKDTSLNVHPLPGVLDRTFCNIILHGLRSGGWFYPVCLVSSTIKTDHNDINEIFQVGILQHLTPITLTMEEFLFCY